MIRLASIPAIDATLNAACTVFLVIGFIFILRGKIRFHRFCMLCAFGCSTVFLAFYLWFHFHAGIIRFGGQGWIRPVQSTDRRRPYTITPSGRGYLQQELAGLQGMHLLQDLRLVLLQLGKPGHHIGQSRTIYHPID